MVSARSIAFPHHYFLEKSNPNNTLHAALSASTSSLSLCKPPGPSTSTTTAAPSSTPTCTRLTPLRGLRYTNNNITTTVSTRAFSSLSSLPSASPCHSMAPSIRHILTVETSKILRETFPTLTFTSPEDDESSSSIAAAVTSQEGGGRLDMQYSNSNSITKLMKKDSDISNSPPPPPTIVVMLDERIIAQASHTSSSSSSSSLLTPVDYQINIVPQLMKALSNTNTNSKLSSKSDPSPPTPFQSLPHQMVTPLAIANRIITSLNAPSSPLSKIMEASVTVGTSGNATVNNDSLANQSKKNTPSSSPSTLLQAAFINITLKDEYLQQILTHYWATATTRRISTQYIHIPSLHPKSQSPATHSPHSPPHPPRRRRNLIDFASPNMGKELHVGHLRSAVVGDTLARVMEYCYYTPTPTTPTGSGKHSDDESTRDSYLYEIDRVSHVGDCGVPVALVMSYVGTSSSSSLSSLVRGTDTTPTTTAVMKGDAPLPTPFELSRIYEAAKKRSSTDPSFAEHVQLTLRRLQTALATRKQENVNALTPSETSNSSSSSSSSSSSTVDTTILEQWERICNASRKGFEPLYERLQVHVSERGESTYAHLLDAVVDDLLKTGVAVIDDGAVVIFVGGEAAAAGTSPPTPPTNESNRKKKQLAAEPHKKGDTLNVTSSASASASNSPSHSAILTSTTIATEPPLLIRKRDGGYLYATIDMAALRSRLQHGYERIIYVTDAAQAPHFKQVFAAAKKAGWIGPNGENMLYTHHPLRVSLEHAAFGVVTGEGGKKLSSRDGTDLTLSSLLDQGVEAVKLQMTSSSSSSSAAAETSTTTPQISSSDIPVETTNQNSATSKRSRDSDASTTTTFIPLPNNNSIILSPKERQQVAEAIAMSAIRFFDLAHKRASNYSFSYSKALALKGHTAPYLQYAVTRLRTLRINVSEVLQSENNKRMKESTAAITTGQEEEERQGGVPFSLSSFSSSGLSSADGIQKHWDSLAQECDRRAAAAAAGAPAASAIHDENNTLNKSPSPHQLFSTPHERALALSIARLPETLSQVTRHLAPHFLAEQAIDIASRTHSAYDVARILPQQGGKITTTRKKTTKTQEKEEEEDDEHMNKTRNANINSSSSSSSDDISAEQWKLAASRIRLFAAADACLRACFQLLGVAVVDRM